MARQPGHELGDAKAAPYQPGVNTDPHGDTVELRLPPPR
jgi:hypothetical protein